MTGLATSLDTLCAQAVSTSVGKNFHWIEKLMTLVVQLWEEETSWIAYAKMLFVLDSLHDTDYHHLVLCKVDFESYNTRARALQVCEQLFKDFGIQYSRLCR